MFLHGGAAVTVSAQSKRPLHSLAGSTRSEGLAAKGKSGKSGYQGYQGSIRHHRREGGGGLEGAGRGRCVGRGEGGVALRAALTRHSQPSLAGGLHWMLWTLRVSDVSLALPAPEGRSSRLQRFILLPGAVLGAPAAVEQVEMESNSVDLDHRHTAHQPASSAAVIHTASCKPTRQPPKHRQWRKMQTHATWAHTLKGRSKARR
jgi:hypothetical protein